MLTVHSQTKRQVIDLTDQIESLLPAAFDGLASLFVLHTTAALTTADLDPGTDLDLLDALEGIIADRRWRHPHNPAHARDHLLASVVGPAVSVPVRQGKLVLGTWQRVVFIELDGPRERHISLTLIASS